MARETETLLANDHLPLALAAVLAGLTVVLTVAAAAFSLFIFVPAAAMGATAFLIWFHATGRLERMTVRRARRHAATGADPGRGGFGAGPREAWRGPRRGRGPRSRMGDPRASAGQRPQQTSGPTPGEARELLGVEEDASTAAIKTAYREKVKETHPDRGGDETKFKRVTEAYELLSE